MFRSIFQHARRVRVHFIASLYSRTICRRGSFLAVTATAVFLVLAYVYAPGSARANLALCLKSLAKEPAEHESVDSRTSAWRAIERCIN
ncbi:UDP-N-acetylmuramate-alanine ligase [Paraburkholderia sp. GAS448]